ncbi:MAG: cache domain-containing protein [Proteobacteria bacterium]|nr:cache domain-containing protein [Pseudomonadota bacterium]MBU1417331.1 cache domain-containing protein [Pseudomonadota bacterium]MBU1454799.1 cache domain-containing protein [Pseudomonadota bacterium]
MDYQALLTSPVKMILPPILAVLLFVGTVFVVILPSFNASLLESKKENIIQLVDVAMRILSHFESQASHGVVSQQEAKTLAISAIRNLRYGKGQKDYFWINDLEPAIIMHPYRPELEGQMAGSLVDENERVVFHDIAMAVSENGPGFVGYRWQRHDDRGEVVDKISYVAIFSPWQWVIGTGLYLDDVKKEISAFTAKLSFFAFLALLLITILSFCIARQSVASDRRRKKAETLLQRHHDQLEKIIQKRTAQLILSNEKLMSEARERQKADKKVTAQNSFLHDVIASLPFPFYVVNIKDYSIALSNRHSFNGRGINSSRMCSALVHLQNNEQACCPEGSFNCPVSIVKSTKKPTMVERTHYDHEGRKLHLEVHGYPVFGSDRQVVQVIKIVVDITVRKRYANKLARLSITDDLTGLLNRRGFLLLAQKQLEIARRKKCNLFLMYADLDNLKIINDTLGHDTGDLTIVETGKMFQAVFREADIIGRVGGDEFTILFTCEEHSEKDFIQRIVERLKEEISLVSSRFALPLKLSISNGVAMFDANNPVTLEELMKSADTLMYIAKKHKKRNCN